jgi:hypothetical protein
VLVGLLLVAQRPGNPVPKALGDVVTALGREHVAKIRFEVEGLEAGMAAVQVLGYLHTLLAGQLAIEKMVEAVYRLPTLIVVRFAHHQLPRIAPYASSVSVAYEATFHTKLK